MTSTNDGKDVKSNQSSGQKGKSYYIDIYKSLDVRLSSECDLRTRTQHLCDTWRRIRSLCLHSLPTTHLHLLSWLQRHTAKTVLQTEWTKPESQEERTSLEAVLDAFIEETNNAAASRGGKFNPWELQLVQRAEWFKSIQSNPWEHPVLNELLNPRDNPPTDEQIIEWLRQERSELFTTRLRQLGSSKDCKEFALSLASAVMDRVRASIAVVPDNVQAQETPADKPTEILTQSIFADTLTKEAGFTAVDWELIIDIEFVLLVKVDRAKTIELAKRTPLRDGSRLVERLNNRLEKLPHEKKLWKNAKEVATLIAHMLITRCMVIPQVSEPLRAVLHRSAVSLARALPPARLRAALGGLAAPAATARHLHALCHAVTAQCPDMKACICELYVRTITAGMNELERLKLKTEKESEARSTEIMLSSWFIQLGKVLSSSARINNECLLTAFSVHPSPLMCEMIHCAPELPRVAKVVSEPPKTTSEFGSWANDSHSVTNLVKTSENLNLKHIQDQANVLSTEFLAEGEALGLSPELCQDLAVLLSGPRVKTLAWDMDREVLLQNCRSYMERTHGGTKALTTELKYLNLDPKQFAHLREEDDDEENDAYYGIEKGYEHLVELEEPEAIWQDAVCTYDAHDSDSTCSESTAYTQSVRRKKANSIQSSDEESNPLSVVAENKRNKKKERPHSKERSRERKPKVNKAIKEKSPKIVKVRAPKTVTEKVPKPVKEKVPKPAKIKIPKPVKEKVLKPKKEKKERLPKPKKEAKPAVYLVNDKVKQIRKMLKKRRENRTKVRTPCVTDSDYDSQGKSSLASLNSDDNASEKVGLDGLFCMKDIDPLKREDSFHNSELSFVNGQVSTTNTQPKIRPTTKPSNSLNHSKFMPEFHYSPVKTSQTVNNDIKNNIYKFIQNRQNTSKTPLPNISSPQRCSMPQAIIKPDEIQLQSAIISPKPIEVPEIPALVIDKKQTELLKKMKVDAKDILKVKKVAKSRQNATKEAKIVSNNPNETVMQIINNYKMQLNQQNASKQFQDAQLQSNSSQVSRSCENPEKPSPNHALSLSQKAFEDFLNGINKKPSTICVNTAIKPVSYSSKIEGHVNTRVNQSTKHHTYFPKKASKAEPKHGGKEEGSPAQQQLDELLFTGCASRTLPISYQQTRLPNGIIEPTKTEYDNFLKELQMSINAGAGTLKNTVIQESNRSSHIPTVATNLKADKISPHCAKSLVTQKKTETAPNTFSRLSYMHRNKQNETNKLQINIPPSNVSATKLSQELDRILANHNITRSNEVMISKVEKVNSDSQKPDFSSPKISGVKITKATNKANVLLSQNNPLLSNILNSPVNTHTAPIKVAQSSALTEKDQLDLVSLLRQQSNLNLSKHQPSIYSVNRNNFEASKSTSTSATHNNAVFNNPTVPLPTTQHNVESKSTTKRTPLQYVQATYKDVNPVETKVPTCSPTLKPHETINKNQNLTKVLSTCPTATKTKQQTQNWESVVNALLAHKTPSRGPSALDMVLNSYAGSKNTTSSLRNQRIIKTNPKTEGNHFQADNIIIPKCNSPPKVIHTNVDTKSKNATGTKAQKDVDKGATKAASSTQNPRKSVKSKKQPKPSTRVTPDLSKRLIHNVTPKTFDCELANEDDPFISSILHSDYDLLEELMDDDLRKEIGELSGDDESYRKLDDLVIKNKPESETKKLVQNRKVYAIENNSTDKSNQNDIASTKSHYAVTNVIQHPLKNLNLNSQHATSQNVLNTTMASKNVETSLTQPPSSVIVAGSQQTQNVCNRNEGELQNIPMTTSCNVVQNAYMPNTQPTVYYSYLAGSVNQVIITSSNYAAIQPSANIPVTAMVPQQNKNLTTPTQFCHVPISKTIEIGHQVIVQPKLNETVYNPIQTESSNIEKKLSKQNCQKFSVNTKIDTRQRHLQSKDHGQPIRLTQSDQQTMNSTGEISCMEINELTTNPSASLVLSTDKVNPALNIINDDLTHTCSHKKPGVQMENTKNKQTKPVKGSRLKNTKTNTCKSLNKGNKKQDQASKKVKSAKLSAVIDTLINKSTVQVNTSTVIKESKTQIKESPVDKPNDHQIHDNALVPSPIELNKNVHIQREADKERLKLKRLTLINRQINHRCFYPAIPLKYSSLSLNTTETSELKCASVKYTNVENKQWNNLKHPTDSFENNDVIEKCTNVDDSKQEPIGCQTDNSLEDKASNQMTTTFKTKSDGKESENENNKTSEAKTICEPDYSERPVSVVKANTPYQNVSIVVPDLLGKIDGVATKTSTTSLPAIPADNEKQNLSSKQGKEPVREKKNTEKQPLVEHNKSKDTNKGNVKLSDGEHKSFKDEITIEELPRKPGDNPLKKSIRFKLRNGKSFKATIHGTMLVNFDTLFSDPSLKTVLHEHLKDENAKCTVNIKQISRGGSNANVKTQIKEINVLKRKHVIETVSLISDDEDDDHHKTIKTEFGTFKYVSRDEHYNIDDHPKVFQKCSVKLKKEILCNIKPVTNDTCYDSVEPKDKSVETADVIEIDDSDTDSEIKTGGNINTPIIENIVTTDIKQLKNALLKDLGVADNEDVNKNSNLESIEILSDTEVEMPDPCLKTDDPKLSQNCLISLKRCDNLLNKCNIGDRDKENDISDNESDDTELSDVLDCDIHEETTLSRSGSFSILNDFSIYEKLQPSIPSSPVIGIFETIASLQNMYQEPTSPVMKIYDDIVSLNEKLQAHVDVVYQLDDIDISACDAEWFDTKSKCKNYERLFEISTEKCVLKTESDHQPIDNFDMHDVRSLKRIMSDYFINEDVIDKLFKSNKLRKDQERSQPPLKRKSAFINCGIRKVIKPCYDVNTKRTRRSQLTDSVEKVRDNIIGKCKTELDTINQNVLIKCDSNNINELSESCIESNTGAHCKTESKSKHLNNRRYISDQSISHFIGQNRDYERNDSISLQVPNINEIVRSKAEIHDITQEHEAIYKTEAVIINKPESIQPQSIEPIQENVNTLENYASNVETCSDNTCTNRIEATEKCSLTTFDAEGILPHNRILDDLKDETVVITSDKCIVSEDLQIKNKEKCINNEYCRELGQNKDIFCFENNEKNETVVTMKSEQNAIEEALQHCDIEIIKTAAEVCSITLNSPSHDSMPELADIQCDYEEIAPAIISPSEAIEIDKQLEEDMEEILTNELETVQNYEIVTKVCHNKDINKKVSEPVISNTIKHKTSDPINCVTTVDYSPDASSTIEVNPVCENPMLEVSNPSRTISSDEEVKLAIKEIFEDSYQIDTKNNQINNVENDCEQSADEVVINQDNASVSGKARAATVVYEVGSGIMLEGIEYYDPVVGKCFVFPYIKPSTNTADDVDAFTLNHDTETDLKVKIPKITYSKGNKYSIASHRKGNIKRKLDTSDERNSNSKKYRKGKNIDYPKFTAATITRSAYAKEYKQLFNYYESLKFSYSRPFHKDHIDVQDIVTQWPICGTFAEEVNQDDEPLSLLFQTSESCVSDPLNQTLCDEIKDEFEENKYASEEINEINFNMGFGERSGRVNQNLEECNVSKLSAATLSDVKQFQPFLLSEKDNYKINFKTDDYAKLHCDIASIHMKNKVRESFLRTTLSLKCDQLSKLQKDESSLLIDNTRFPFYLSLPDFFDPCPIETVVQVVQVGQLPVSAAAQNPVTCDPRVTHVSDASPSQCSVENSPRDDSQAIKTEYTELTTADLSLPLAQNYALQNEIEILHETQESLTNENIPIEKEIKSEIKIEIVPETNEELNKSNENEELDLLLSKEINNVEYAFHSNNTGSLQNNAGSNDHSVFNSTGKSVGKSENFTQEQQQNGSLQKSDQIAHAMNAAGIATSTESMTNARTQALVNILSQKIRQGAVVSTHQQSVAHTTSNSYPKTTSINAMALQQALAQILPPPLNQTGSSENNQQVQNAPQVLHIVQGKSASGNQITLVDNSQPSVISNTNSTPVLHLVQNKMAAVGPNSNGTPATQTNSFSGLSLVDTGLQQGGNQLLHIVNTGSQKNNATGQLLKRVNLLTNLTNVQGSNEQKMVQFVCKSADGKSIQLNGPHQRSMVLRLQPIESPNVQQQQSTVQQKPMESQEISQNHAAGTISTSGKDANSQQEIKSRSVYEENYAKFIQNSSTKPGSSEKSTSLPKFNQAFGKQIYQDGNQKQNEPHTNLTPTNNSTENIECQQSDNTLNLEQLGQISNPPLLIRKSPAQTSQSQPNIVQHIKQTIAPMNIQTMHGGVIYTRQIPVNIGGGQTINLITVPSTELIDDSAQKQHSDVKYVNQSEMEPSIIKIVPQSQPSSNSDSTTEDANNHASGANDNASNPQPQQVLTQMRIKLPMLSKTPQMVSGARVVRPSFFQIQRNVISGNNQPVYQQLVLTAAPPLGQQTVRLPQVPSQAVRQAKVESQSSPESQMSSSTLEQLREFDMVLEQVKERSTVQPNSNSSSFTKIHTTSTDTTDSSSSVSTTQSETTQQVLYSIGSNSQQLNVAYVNRKPAPVTPANYVRSPDSSGIADSPSSSSSHTQILHTVTSEPVQSEAPSQPKPTKSSSKSKSRPKSSSNLPNSLKINSIPPKTSTQKPLEDEQTTQRILYILAEYKEQVENSPDKDKPAPRRRTNPPSNPCGSSKRKKSSSGSRRSGGRDMSPVHGDDTCRTMGSEDSSCGTSQGDCNESCVDSHSPQDSPRKVVRKLTFEPETVTAQPRPQPQRNVIVADGQTITVARGTAGKPATAVLMPANYILPVSMMKGGQQIAIVTNRGPKLLTVGGGEGGATNALLLQRLIGPGGLKPMLARPGVRHVRLPTAALHNLQAFNMTTATTVQPPDSTASPAPAPTPPDLVDTRAINSPWTDRESDVKPERGSSPDGSEPWNIPSADHDYNYEETVRTDNMDRTVLDPIQDRYSPEMEAQRIFDKMFDVESKKSYIADSPRCGYDIDTPDDEKTYHQVVQKKDGSIHRQHRLTHVSAAALRHKYAILEHELRLQKSLSEECEDLGVDSPSASELFPEAELLFAASPAHDHTQDHHHHSHTPQPMLSQSIPQPDMDDQIATDQLIQREPVPQRPELDVNLGLEDVGIVTVSEDGMQATIALDQEEFARSHPNTTFHSEPTEGLVHQPFTITGLKARHITSTIFHANRAPTTVLMTAPQSTVISQAAAEPNHVKYNDMINIPGTHTNNINLTSVLVKDDGLTRFDNILTDTRELHLSNTASAIVHSGNAAQVIRRVCYDEDKRGRFLMDEPEGLIAGDDAKMAAEDSSRDATMESMADVDDDRSSPERHTELFWESNSASERSESRRPLDYDSDSDKCCKSPSFDETNSTDSSGVGTHMRLDSVIKEARVDRSASADGSSADDTHPPLRTYPPKRMYHSDMERSLSGKTRAGERSPESSEVRRRASGRGVVKRGCHCCNGSPAPPRPKKSRQKKPSVDFSN